jgi:transcriptional regulator GlxA family with amidase domain
MNDPIPEKSAGESVVVAVAFMLAHVGRPLTIGEIAAAANVSSRELQQQFRDQTGVSPLRHLQQLRLDGVHTSLRTTDTSGSGGTVHDIVRQWGFVHYGRFSAAYTDRYGETPNTTFDRSL